MPSLRTGLVIFTKDAVINCREGGRNNVENSTNAIFKHLLPEKSQG